MGAETTNNRHWLSTGAEALALRIDPTATVWDCDVLIVGSGYGGACAAQTLAGSTRSGDDRPARVWVLERGEEYPPGRFPSRLREVAGHVRFATQDGSPPRGNARGLFDLRLGGDMSVLLGSGLGGGSLINSGVMAVPEERVFKSGWPAGTDLASLGDWYQRALGLLQPMKLPDEITLAKLTVLDGLGPDPAKPAERCAVTVNFGPEDNPRTGARVPTCTLCGDCLTGCNIGAKRSLDTNLLVTARAAGAEIFCGGFVERLEPVTIGDDEGWLVHWHLTEPAHRGEASLKLRARNVVLAAGTLGSTEILKRSEEAWQAAKLPLALSPRLGEAFSGNGDSIIAARGHPVPAHAVADEATDPAGGRRVGPTITGMQQFPQTGSHCEFVLEEFAVPAPLKHLFGEITALLGMLQQNPVPPPTGGDPFANTDLSLERTSLFGLIVDEARPNDALVLPKVRSPYSLEGGIGIEAGGWLNSTIAGNAARAVPFRDGAALLSTEVFAQRLPFCTHPLGGCGMGDDFSKGVVDLHGEVFLERGGKVVAHSGLAVLDGAAIPTALVVNPALTISALALRGAEAMRNAWGLVGPAAGNTTATALLPKESRPFIDRPAADPANATWRIRERQSGVGDGAAGPWAGRALSLDVEFEQIHGFRRLLMQQPPLILNVRRAALHAGAGAGYAAQTWPLSGTVSLLVRESWSPNEDPPLAFKIRYDLEEVVPDGTPPGLRVVGIKRFDPLQLEPAKGANGTLILRSPWRELSEIDLGIDDLPVGRLALDLGDLADQQEALLKVLTQTSTPDMLDDLGGIGLFLFRHVLIQLMRRMDAAKASLGKVRKRSILTALRQPGRLNGIDPTPLGLAQCRAVMRIYRAPDATRDPAARPALLIHGLAMSGNCFTHPALNGGLAAELLNRGRDVIVCDLASSIAQTPPEKMPASAWTVEAIAADLAVAFSGLRQELGEDYQVDVFGHCFGGVMFCVAALDHPQSVARHVRSAVLSQVGPSIELSPLNRLRGFLSAYLWRFGLIDEFDCVPADDGRPSQLIAALCATFPYPDDEARSGMLKVPSVADLVRHRADVIFGQMYLARNVGATTQAVLEELLGWVKAPLLAQTIQFARHEMLTDADGRNRRLTAGRLKRGFAFPVLFLHGRENRVFEVNGALRSLSLLRQSRGLGTTLPPPQGVGKVTWYGQGQTAQVAVLEGYGHLDAVIGDRAAVDVFPLVTAFFSTSWSGSAAPVRPAPLPQPAQPQGAHAPPQIELPWIGPMLGVLELAPNGWTRARVIVHAPARRTTVATVVLVPLRNTAAGLSPDLDLAHGLTFAHRRRRILKLDFDTDFLTQEGIDRVAVLTLHHGLDFSSGIPRSTWLLQPFVPGAQQQWVIDAGRRPPLRAAGTRPLPPGDIAALKAWFAEPVNGDWRDFSISLRQRLIDGCRRSHHVRFERPLTFALASCQYPPGPLDEGPAMAAYGLLRRVARTPTGPQFLLLTGDQVYVDNTAGLFDPGSMSSGDRVDTAAFRTDLTGIYERAWRLRQARAAMAELPVLAMIDDHELWNDFPGMPMASAGQRPDPAANQAIKSAAAHQVKLAYGRRLGSARSRSYEWNAGGLPFFMLETRLSRRRRTLDTLFAAEMLPADVLTALVDRLARIPAHVPKFIVSSTPLLPPERFGPDTDDQAMRLRSDSWSGYPATASALMTEVLARNIHGVVLLAGDPHLSSVTSFEFDDAPGLIVHSVVSSGLHAPWPFANQRPEDAVFDGPVRIGGVGPSGEMRQHCMTTRDGFAVVETEPATAATAARLLVTFHHADDQSRQETRLDVGAPMVSREPS